MGYIEIIMVLISLVLICLAFRDKNGLPSNWPFVGMLPALLKNINRIHEYLVEILEKSHLTFIFEGPWFTNMQILVTIDPSNINHVMSKHFSNYPKGSKFNERFDVLGDGIFNADYVVWQYHRKMVQDFFGHPNYNHFLVKKTMAKVENGIIPVLDHASDHAIDINLQDLFSRFTFDVGCTIMMDHDPKTLSVDFRSSPASEALDDVEETIYHRHILPTCVWKFQRWLNVGKEKKYKQAWETLDSFIYKCMVVKREKLSEEQQQPSSEQKEDNKVCTDLLSLYMEEDANHKTPLQGDKFMRDTVLTTFIAGRDAISIALSWFFYLLSKNPKVASKIKKELDNVTIDWSNVKEMNTKLIYLHAALCECLRLYPPIVFETKAPIESDVLPTGHHVNPDTMIVFNMYAMGRMKAIWGEDCNEFKPERWITEQGNIKHEPSYKYFVFNAGPRSCVGKRMTFIQMKIVIATIIRNYFIDPVDEHQVVVPTNSIFLHMHHGFKVRVSRRFHR